MSCKLTPLVNIAVAASGTVKTRNLHRCNVGAGVVEVRHVCASEEEEYYYRVLISTICMRDERVWHGLTCSGSVIMGRRIEQDDTQTQNLVAGQIGSRKAKCMIDYR